MEVIGRQYIYLSPKAPSGSDYRYSNGDQIVHISLYLPHSCDLTLIKNITPIKKKILGGKSLMSSKSLTLLVENDCIFQICQNLFSHLFI